MHFFNVEIAKIVGIIPAILFQHIQYWIAKNIADRENYRDGVYWTYTSRKSLCAYFPYLTERQIEYATKKLLDEGLIISGNYNKVAYDRTLWYSITPKGNAISQNCEMEITNLKNGNNENVEPIPYIKTNNKTNKSFSTKKSGASKTKNNYDEVFNNPENKIISEALVKWVKACKDRGVGFQYKTLLRWAGILRDNAGENPEIALAIVQQSINERWKDLYPLKRGKASANKPRAIYEPFDPEKHTLATDAEGNPLVY